MIPIHFFKTKQHQGLDQPNNKLSTPSQGIVDHFRAYHFEVFLLWEEGVGAVASSRDEHATADGTIFSALQIKIISQHRCNAILLGFNKARRHNQPMPTLLGIAAEYSHLGPQLVLRDDAHVRCSRCSSEKSTFALWFSKLLHKSPFFACAAWGCWCSKLHSDSSSARTRTVESNCSIHRQDRLLSPASPTISRVV